ncbi:hypothetical protein HHK36_019383 [Tetracentron sinense]|uniref:Uncharacterized protein n=1 Tax=Tetracentron sinense TaxID=13715 RepID=A0A834Z240_TETSI|nr:hypothetical protein HHK36_019383 [Tetracentron sinense]
MMSRPMLLLILLLILIFTSQFEWKHQLVNELEASPSISQKQQHISKSEETVKEKAWIYSSLQLLQEQNSPFDLEAGRNVKDIRQRTRRCSCAYRPLTWDVVDMGFAIRPSAACICVEVDLLKSLPEKIWIGLGGSGNCSHCQKQGHLEELCKFSGHCKVVSKPHILQQSEEWVAWDSTHNLVDQISAGIKEGNASSVNPIDQVLEKQLSLLESLSATKALNINLQDMNNIAEDDGGLEALD